MTASSERRLALLYLVSRMPVMTSRNSILSEC
jgi:hypothetical protein